MSKKKILVFGIILFVCFVTGIVCVTYSKYITTFVGTTNVEIAKWTVRVNDTDVSTNTTFNLDNSYIMWSSSDKIADGYIAPGRTGVMKIKLDTTECDVNVKYTLTVDSTFLNSYEQINITKINNEVVTDGSYTGIITLDDIDTVEIPIELTWENSTTNNSSDTEIASTIDNLSIPVSLTVEQYAGV